MSEVEGQHWSGRDALEASGKVLAAGQVVVTLSKLHKRVNQMQDLGSKWAVLVPSMLALAMHLRTFGWSLSLLLFILLRDCIVELNSEPPYE